MINRPVEAVFAMVYDFEKRLLWYQGVDQLVFEKDRVNRVGSTHQCLIGKHQLEFETVTGEFGPNTKVYGEWATQIPLAREVVFYYILSEAGAGTRLRFEGHYEIAPPLRWLKTFLFRLVLGRKIPVQLQALKEACEKQA
jgi:hypothetical protein